MDQLTQLLKRWLLHSLFLILFQNLAALVFYISRSRDIIEEMLEVNFDQPTIPIILISIAFVEINYEFLFKRNIFLFILGSYLTGLLSSTFIIYLNPAFDFGPEILFNEPTLVIALYAFTYPPLSKFLKQRFFKTRLLYEESRAELDAIKSQINPHFLFNTLNSIYALALREKAERTGDAIGELSEMMRYVLEHSEEDMAQLKDEIEFIEQYVSLQELRLPEETLKDITFSKNIQNENIRIPHMVFLPFLENTFKYGIGTKRKAAIKIHLESDSNTVLFQLQNQVMNKSKGMGTGLKNLKKRLDLLYENNYELDISEKAEVFKVNLKLKS